MEDYNLVFSIYYTTKSDPIVYNPYSTLKDEQITIKWPDFSLNWEYSENSFTIHFPEVNYIKYNISNVGGVLIIPKKEGLRETIFNYNQEVLLEFEILSIHRDHMIFLMGLKKI